jgi:hypothetical protein
MKVGDVVRRTYGEGGRPCAFVLEHFRGDWWLIRWFGRARKEEMFEGRWLEVVNGSR